MNIKPIKLTCLTLVCGALLSACGGSGDNGTGPDRFAIERNSAKVSIQPLAPSAASGFATHLKNGLYTASINQNCAECAVTSSASQASDAAASSEDFTNTNTQESGVDEADRIKYNGEHLYVVANPYFDPIHTMGQQDYIKVYAREQGDLNYLSTINLPEDFMTLKGLYLNDDTLVGMGNSVYWAAVSSMDIWHPIEQQVNVAIYDVSDVQSPQINQHIQFDGYLISSRKVEHKLYIVSSYSPTVLGLNYGASSDEQKQNNFDIITGTDINDLLPKMTINGADEQNLVSADNCFIPQDASAIDGYDSIVTLTSINLDNPEDRHSVCINALTHDIYASKESIYFMGVDAEQQGVIHRFALDDDLSYAGTGNVDGHFGWRSASFRLSEHEGHLRVVTSKNGDDGPLHQLFVLQTEGENNSLPVVAQLPNDQQPEAIGKPNEDIFAVRYFNDKAYVVTFEQIDPLYVIDINQPDAPFIAGELEIPGFSSYLHPINDNLLLGVGQEVNNGVLPGNGNDDAIAVMPVMTGAKVALFDVSNPANPVQVETLVYDDAYTPVEWDHHALTVQAVDDNHFRFALPMSRWFDSSNNTYINETYLNLLEVNISDVGAELVERSPIVAPVVEDVYYYIDSYLDRSVIHGDDIYYVHGNEVVEGVWP